MQVPLFKVNMAPDAHERVAEVLQSGYVSQGPKVKEFEEKLSAYLQRQVLTVNSGTSALELALYLAGVRTGDEVITTPVTCTATNGAIIHRGARPVWADVDPETGNIDPEDVARKITPRTKAIMAVDWGGRPCDYALLYHPGIRLIVDAAHSFGATHEFLTPQFTCWSFQAIKHLTTGDGGALAVEDQYQRTKLLRWFGLDRESSASFRCEQNIQEVGWKMHMNDIAASIGLANLPFAKKAVEMHRENARFYEEAFAGQKYFITPPPSKESAWWLYTLRVDGARRGSFIRFLQAHGIEASPVHARNDRHSAFHYPNGPLPGVDEFASMNVAIPVGWWLSPKDRERVASVVLSWRPE